MTTLFMSNFRLNHSIGSREPLSALSNDLLAKLFPFGLAFDRAMQIVQIGKALQQLYPAIAIGNSVETHFVIRDFDGAIPSGAISDDLILLESRHDLLRFQGQMLSAESPDVIIFLGLPQVKDLPALQALEAVLLQPPHGFMSDYLLLLQARTRNLSDLRHLATQLAEQRADWQRTLSQAKLMAAVVEQAPEAIVLTDPNTQIIQVNAAFERLTGYPQIELVGKSAAGFLEIELNQGIAIDRFWETIATDRSWQGKMTIRCKDGSGSLQEASVFPIQNRLGKVTHLTCCLREAAQRTSTSTSAFPSNSPHVSVAVSRHV